MLNLLKTVLKFTLIAALIINSAGQGYALRPMAAGVSSLDEGMFMTETVKSMSTGKRKGIDIQFSDKRKINKQLEKIIKFLKDGYRPNEDGYKTHMISFWHQPYISTRAAGSIGHFSKKGYTERVDKEFWQPLEKLLSDVLVDDDSADLKIFFDNLKKILRKSEHVLIRSRSFRVRYATNTLAYARALELIDRQQEILNRFGIKIASEFQLLLEDIINDFFDSHNEYYGVEQDGTFWVKVFAGDVMRFVLEQSRLGSHLIEAEEILLSNLDFVRQYSARFVLFSERKIRSPYDIKDTPVGVYNKAIEFLKIENIYDDHIVDFGCGRGRFLIYLDSRLRTNSFSAPPLHFWGYDNSEVMVKSARNKGLDARKADLSNKGVLSRLRNQLSKTYGYKDSYSDQFNKAVAIDLLQDFTTEGKENFLDFLSGKAFLEKGRCFISLFIGKGDRKRTKEDFLKLIQKRENLIVEFAEADDSRVYIGVIKELSTIKSVYNGDAPQAGSSKTSSGGQQKIEVIEKVNPPKNKPVLVLCDVHGTLLAPTWEKEYREVFEKLMGDYPSQEWMSKYIFGKTDNEILQALSSESGKSTSEVADIVEQVRNQIREKETTQEIPEAVDFLWALRRVGIPSAIISGTKRELLISQLKRVGLYYATSRYWPEKHIYASAAKDRNKYNRAKVIEKIWEDFDKPTIVYFDDWIEGMQKVRQLGGICVGLPQGEGEVFKVNREKLIEAGAHYILTGGYDYKKIIDEILDPVFVNVLDIGSGNGEGTWIHPTLASLMAVAGDSISPGSFDGIVLGVRKWMAKKGICNILVQVVGLDKDKKMVEEARMRHHNVHLIHLVKEQNMYTGFPPNSFDLITIFAPPDVDEWFVRDVMPEVKRLLTTEKSGGEIWIQPYISGTPDGYSTRDDRGFPEFKSTLEENGFIVEVRKNNAGEFIVGKLPSTGSIISGTFRSSSAEDGKAEQFESYSNNIGDYRRLRHQIAQKIRRIKDIPPGICSEQIEQLIEIYSVFEKILNRLIHRGAPISSVTEKYNERDINIYEAVDILQSKVLSASNKASQNIEAGQIDQDGYVYQLSSITMLLCGLIDKYAKKKEPVIRPLHIYPLLLQLKSKYDLLDINTEIEGDKNIIVMGSSLEFFEVFEQLGDNAAEHGMAQNLYISIRRKNGMIEIAFKDDGKGMPDEALAKDKDGIAAVFKKYTTRPKEGGMGLPIIRDIITKWNGIIAVESEPNVGTTFTIYLPAHEQVEPREESLKPSSAGGVLEKLSHAVSLTQLECSIEPELRYAAILANIMLPSFWNLAGEAIETTTKTGAPLTTRHIMRNLKRYVNMKTTLLGDLGATGDRWGWSDLEKERKRLGTANVDEVKAKTELFSRRNYRLGFDEVRTDKVIKTDRYKTGKYPRWRSTIYDISLAFAEKVPNSRAAVNCADIACFFASANFAIAHQPLENFILIGSPGHYITFLNQDGGYLFTNKDGFTKNNISDIEPDFIKMIGIDRIITASGVYRIDRKTSTIPNEELAAILKTLRDFFARAKIKIRGTAPSSIKQVKFSPKKRFPKAEFLGLKSAEGVQNRIYELAKRYPNSVYEKALYAHRSLQVPHPEVYLLAALRDEKVREEAAKLKGLEDAITFVKSIKDDESVLGTIDRIVLPDEVLLFKTGSHRDKALLLYTLFYHMGLSDNNGLAIYFTDNNSYVFHNGLYISTKSWRKFKTLPTEKSKAIRLPVTKDGSAITFSAKYQPVMTIRKLHNAINTAA